MKKISYLLLLGILLYSCEKDQDDVINITNVINDTIFIVNPDTLPHWFSTQTNDANVSVDINFLFSQSNSSGSTSGYFKLSVYPKPDLDYDVNHSANIQFAYSTKVDAYNYSKNQTLFKKHSTYGGGFLESSAIKTAEASKVYDLEYGISSFSDNDLLVFTVFGDYDVYDGTTLINTYNYSRQVAMVVRVID